MYSLLLLCFAALLHIPLTSSGPSSPDSLNKQQKWYMPDAVTMQYAGNMGMLAVGPGYDLAGEKVALDVLYGYVPKFQASQAGHILTLKATYKPFKVELGQGHTLTPFQIGLGLSYHFGEQYTLYWQDPYPKGYYWWSPKLRTLGFAGTAINKSFTDKVVKDVGVYAELGTYELLVTSWYKDEKLRLWDIMSASVGVRARF